MAATKSKARKARAPAKLSPDKARAEILERLAMGESLNSICQDARLPCRRTVYSWIYNDSEFEDEYVRAKRLGIYALEDELMEIADDGRNDWMEITNRDGDNAGWKINGEAVARSRLRIETRRWYMERLEPRRFGNRVDLNHDVAPESPLAQLIGEVSGATLRPAPQETTDQE